MDEFYLALEKKKYYGLDFQKLLKLEGSWEIDNELKPTLIRINEYFHYQTLYSKKYRTEPDSLNLGGDSYLDITSTKETWGKLSDILTAIKGCTNNSSCIEIIEFEPQDNPYLNLKSQFDIGCIKDPDYFRIKHFRIKIESPNTECHSRFWECISKQFL